MDFTHYSDEAVAIAVDLVNSRGSWTGLEYLPDSEAVIRFLGDHGLPAPRSVGKREIENVHTLRERLSAAFTAPDEKTSVNILNKLLDEVGTHPQLTDHDGGGWHLHYVPAGKAVSEQLTAVAAMGLASVIAEHGFRRIGICSADECRDVYIDMSRNKSRRYCDDSCSSRMNVAAYRSRRKQDSA
ncbi:MAG: CGNR zinc finger domain-containing protein [Actinobacteria bacterium]|nr:CGNR zinc finger domain-containing protein [Actinomycetota bacterium]